MIFLLIHHEIIHNQLHFSHSLSLSHTLSKLIINIAQLYSLSGAFWAHGSTETTIYNDFYDYDEQTGDRTNVESAARNCQDPIVQNQVIQKPIYSFISAALV